MLTLASASPYRLQLLRAAGYEVDAVAAAIDESMLELDPDLEAGLVSLAQRKAFAVCRRGVEGLILAADTVGVVAGRVLGKPESRDEARQMLSGISGTRHDVLTGWCVLRSHDRLLLSGVERTGIVMRDWSDQELENYLESGEWQGKCGAYGLQPVNDPFVTAIEGSISNVIGLPMERLQSVLLENFSVGQGRRSTDIANSLFR